MTTTPSLFPIDQALVVPGARLELVPPARWIFRLPRELRTLNDVIGAHWRVSQAARQAWEQELVVAMSVFLSARTVEGWREHERRAYAALTAHRERRRVRIGRFVPQRKCFISDDDNLAASAKQLFDAMTRQQLLVDDRREWVERAPIAQHVSPDGKFWTVVQLDRPDASGAWR